MMMNDCTIPCNGVCVRKKAYVVVGELDGVVEGVGLEAHQHRPEDLLLVAAHVRCHVGDDGGA